VIWPWCSAACASHGISGSSTKVRARSWIARSASDSGYVMRVTLPQGEPRPSACCLREELEAVAMLFEHRDRRVVQPVVTVGLFGDRAGAEELPKEGALPRLGCHRGPPRPLPVLVRVLQRAR